MSSFAKFYEIIDRSSVGDFIARKKELIDKTDPDRIYVENIRSFFNMPTRVARFFCELAVREGVFAKRIGFLCPNDQQVIESFGVGVEPPEELMCEICEDNERDQFLFAASDMDTTEIYSLVSAN